MDRRGFVAVFLVFCLHHVTFAQNQAALDDVYRQAGQRESAQDEAGAIRLYEQAARQGHVWSMVRLGYLRQQGIGCAKDPAAAVGLYAQAANAGSLDGQFMLAMSMAEGLGTRKNPAAAREMLLQPASKGHQYAQFALGIMLESGEGGPKKETAARRWMDRAAAGPDRSLAARAASVRAKIDQKILAPDNSGGVLVGLILFMALAGAAMGGGGGGSGTIPMSTSGPFGGGGSSTIPPARPCHPVPINWFDSTTPNGSRLFHPSQQSSMGGC
jgi:Sel1 repeat